MLDQRGDAEKLPRWYVVYLRSRHEKRVHEKLLLRGIESFQPTIAEVRQWSDRKKIIEVPLFPGYDFVRIDLREKVKVMEVEGVVRFVSIRNRPTPVPDEQVGALKKVLVSPATLRKEWDIHRGQDVEVIGGPFAGVRGTILREKGLTRVVIAIDCIEQAVSVEVPASFLRKPQQMPAGITIAGRLLLLILGVQGVLHNLGTTLC